MSARATPAFRWLGQAGFELSAGERTIVVDPYLSDSLAQKYAGRLFEHTRSFPPPVDPSELRCDLVVCTHRHTDHMDAATLMPLLGANPGLRVAVPRAERHHAIEIGLPAEALVEMSAGRPFSPLDGVTVTPIPAAHEELQVDADGEHHFLGVVIDLGGVTVYHSGDCVPYEGQADRLRELEVDVALLPVNGRDGYRARNGVPGNFWVDEAIELCEAARIPAMVAHHVGLFDFNTVPFDHLRRVADRSTTTRCLVPDVGEWYPLSASDDDIG